MAEATGRGGSRNWRLCFRTTRGQYWAVKDMAREHGWAASTLCYWMVEHMMTRLAAAGFDDRMELLRSLLGPAGLAALERDVEKGIARGVDQDVPW
jgi:hypothetical protein